MTIVASLNPKNYFFYRLEDRDKWTYPLAGVALIVALILIETALTYLVFTARRPRLLWIRALLGLLILGPWGFFVAMWVVHAPMFYLLHIVYVWLLIAITVFGASGLPRPDGRALAPDRNAKADLALESPMAAALPNKRMQLAAPHG